MPLSVSVLYKQGVKFSKSYYRSHHMTLVKRHWTQYGLRDITVIGYPADAPFAVQAILKWDSMADRKRALASDSVDEIMNDIKNFASEQPIIIAGEEVFTSADI